jgi:hypothetical protein
VLPQQATSSPQTTIPLILDEWSLLEYLETLRIEFLVGLYTLLTISNPGNSKVSNLWTSHVKNSKAIEKDLNYLYTHNSKEII